MQMSAPGEAIDEKKRRQEITLEEWYEDASRFNYWTIDECCVHFDQLLVA